jgi:hypothetical protein
MGLGRDVICYFCGRGFLLVSSLALGVEGGISYCGICGLTWVVGVLGADGGSGEVAVLGAGFGLMGLFL